MKKIIYKDWFYTTLCARNTANVKINALTLNEIPYEIEVIADNLYIPWAMDISDEGKLYFTERSGAIRVVEKGKLLQQPLITFGAPSLNEEGTEVEKVESWLQNEYGRLREVIQANDGSIYLMTNNRDGRGGA